MSAVDAGEATITGGTPEASERSWGEASRQDDVRRLRSLPALLILAPMLVSIGVWLLPTDPRGLSGFIQRANFTGPGLALVVAWVLCAILVASVAFSSARRRPPIRSLSFVGLDEFHVAACIIGAIGTVSIYWSVTGGSLSVLVDLWTHQEFYKFGEFDYGVGLSTGRYASVLAAGLSFARLFTGRRLRPLDFASFFLLAATVLLNSRISAFMALASAAAIIAFSEPRYRLRLGRIAAAATLIIVLFVYSNYSRSASFYRSQGVNSPIEMALINADSYLATPTQVTAAVSAAAMDGRALPPTSPVGALRPVVPLFVMKAIGEGEVKRVTADNNNVEHRYQNTVDLSLSLTTNGTLIDVLMVHGWWALVSALAVISGAVWIAGRFATSGPIGAAVGGVLLYGLFETWRVFIFNAGSVHFILLMGLGAVAVGALRSKGWEAMAAQVQIPSAGRPR